jgi:hypothetical protein
MHLFYNGFGFVALIKAETVASCCNQEEMCLPIQLLIILYSDDRTSRYNFF